jgi:hypothetical protein
MILASIGMVFTFTSVAVESKTYLDLGCEDQNQLRACTYFLFQDICLWDEKKTPNCHFTQLKCPFVEAASHMKLALDELSKCGSFGAPIEAKSCPNYCRKYSLKLYVAYHIALRVNKEGIVSGATAHMTLDEKIGYICLNQALGNLTTTNYRDNIVFNLFQRGLKSVPFCKFSKDEFALEYDVQAAASATK